MPPHPPAHEPLSQSLERLVGRSVANGPLTANQFLESTGGRGLYLVMILLALPFVAWVSVPGMSTLLGLMIGWLAVRLALGKRPRLPARLGDRPLSPKTKRAILTGGLKFCRFLEKGVRPRRSTWMNWRLTHRLHALLIVLLALLLMLPLPSPPFLGSNALPSYAIILVAVSMMEEDGVMIFLGYLASVVTMGYFLLLGGWVTRSLAEWMQTLLRLLERAG
jgi:hypothetical protein